MDHFGIGLALRGMFQTYLRCARQTGRTTSLIDSVRDGDRIVFVNEQQARLVKGRLHDRGLKTVECVVVPPDQVVRLFEMGTPKGRTIFDHVWIEAFYERAIDRALAEVDHLQRETSGPGAAHEETRIQAMAEISHRRWR